MRDERFAFYGGGGYSYLLSSVTDVTVRSLKNRDLIVCGIKCNQHYLVEMKVLLNNWNYHPNNFIDEVQNLCHDRRQ